MVKGFEDPSPRWVLLGRLPLSPSLRRGDQQLRAIGVLAVHVVVGVVVGVGHEDADRLAHPGGSEVGLGLLEHRMEYPHVGLVVGEVGGHHDLVLGDHGLAV